MVDPVRLVGRDVFDRMVTVRRELHRRPELSWKERETAQRIQEQLDILGIPHQRGVAGTGVVAELPGAGGGPAIALRADIDALPLGEETGLPFASEIEGVMHACGHDAHTAMLIGAGELLARERGLPRPVRLIFQPAEETGAGAPKLVELGVLDGVAMIFGGHVDRLYRPGEIMIAEGTVNASTDQFRIELEGPGGHAARPHETANPIAVGADLVERLGSLVERECGSDADAVVAVGMFHAGTATNVIPSRATLEGTVRALTPAAREQLLNAIEREATLAAQDHVVGVAVEFTPGTPPVENIGPAVALARAAAVAALGEASVVAPLEQNMGGEDFGFYLERVPGCFVRFGAMPDGRSHPAHSSRFVLDERVLAVGAAWLARVAVLAGEAVERGGEGAAGVRSPASS